MQPIIVRIWHGLLPIWVWWFVCAGAGQGQTLSQFLEDWSSESETALAEEDVMALEDLLQAPPVLTKEALEVLGNIGWLTPEESQLLKARSLPCPLSRIDGRELTPETGAFFELWNSISRSSTITGQIIQSQRWGKGEFYRWRSHFLLPHDWQLDWVMDRSAGDEIIPADARKTLAWDRPKISLWFGDLQVRLGSGLFSAGSFPVRVGPESIATFQRWNFSLRSHRSSLPEGRVSGFGVIGQTDFGRFLGTWSAAGEPASCQVAWSAPESRGTWGSAIRFAELEQVVWEGSIFGQVRREKISITGEAAKDQADHSGVFMSAHLRRKGIGVLISGRLYAPGFHPVLANPPRQRSSLADGETGFFQAIRITRYPLKIDLYLDASQTGSREKNLIVSQGIRSWGRTKLWRWRVTLDWRDKTEPSAPVFSTGSGISFSNRHREKIRITRNLDPHWKVRVQWNHITVKTLAESFRGWGIRGETDYRGDKLSWTLAGTIVPVSDPMARVYFWKLNLP
ncbi:MAG: hypothetical protein ACE5D1_02080, partial [Fidelibacterota bacterium]